MRWRPTRAGIFNIWEYDDQVFDFGDGRLVLRGRNGSGKSNALSLLFPFLFDGVMSSARMDPMGGARSMKSLLLGRDDGDTSTGRYRHESGTGYVWMEFERHARAADVETTGGIERVSIGIGASATQQRDAQAWFFLTGLRIGDQLPLHDDDVPRSSKRLREALAAEREHTPSSAAGIYQTADEFRSAVDAALFGLGTSRYRTLVDLLLTLRRPHLAGKLDTEHLSTTLSSGLAGLDNALIDDVAHSFDDLDAMQEELEGLGSALDAIERFLPTYREHLVGAGRRRASLLVEAQRSLMHVGRQLAAADREATDATVRLAQHGSERDANRIEQDRLDVDIETIQVSPAYQSATALGEVKRQAESARIAANAAVVRCDQDEQRVRDAAEEAHREAARADTAGGKLTAAITTWVGLARSIDLAGTTSAANTVTAFETVFDENGQRFDAAIATALVAARTQQVDEVDTARRASERATAEAERATSEAEHAATEHAIAIAESEARGAQVTAEQAALRERRDEWADAARLIVDDIERTTGEHFDGLTELLGIGPAAPADDAHDAADAAALDERGAEGDSDSDTDTDMSVRGAIAWDVDVVPERVTTQMTAWDLALTRAADRADTQRRATAAELGELVADRHRVADEPNPGPPLNPTRPDAARPARPGAPLFVCVDFPPHLTADDRAGLEAALAAAGLLDARITPDGLATGDLDAALVRAPSTPHDAAVATLADVLVPVATLDLSTDQIDAALRSVPLDSDVVRIDVDGHWRLGPLTGRHHQATASFIGHEARERRRAERLAELDARIAATQNELADHDRRIARLGELIAQLADTRTRFPSASTLRQVHRLFSEAVTVRRERAQRARITSDLAAETAVRAESMSAELHRVGVARRLPVDADSLEAVKTTLRSCTSQQNEIDRRRESLEDAARTAHAAADRRAVAATQHAAAVHDAQQATQHAASEALRYERLQADVGADAQQAIADLEAARSALRQARSAADLINAAVAASTAEIARLTERAAQLGDQRRRLTVETEDATARFATICSPEVAGVLAVGGVDDSAEPLAAARALLASTGEVSDDATNRMEREHRNVLLDGLRAGHDPSMPKIDGLDVVRIGTADGDMAIGALAADLRQDRDRLDQLLSDREPEIFETHLLTRVGEALRRLLLEADQFESTINAEMSKAPTSSGMTVELRWVVDDDDRPVRDAVEALRFAPENMSNEKRDALRDFFTQRINDLRATDPGLSFSEILSTALDYRRWHRFDLFVRSAQGGRSRVTRAYFRGLSGGEAATVLHLPLFAAASAHYASGNIAGPRIIALDEAFAGIDDQMRGRLMGLLVQLDLDVILTSHEFWGFYGQVPGLVLYDLNRKPPVPGVFAQRFEWHADQ